VVKRDDWLSARKYSPETLSLARKALEEVRAGRLVDEAVRRYPLPGGGYLAKHALVAVYRQLTESGEWPPDSALLERIRMKPVRTLSGVTTVTVLTKPYPCPGECIFCPDDPRMPKSYLPDEPGARRGLEHDYDPYGQVASRIQALEAVGHPTDKIELLILGGTWSCYPRTYQEWFVRRCFDAMNAASFDLPSQSAAQDTPRGALSVVEDHSTLEEAHSLNETALHRNVGLVIETRPDRITPGELAWLRQLGVTKVQMGAQSLDDRLLALNKRGHTVAETQRATALLRAAGFKIVLHWMPNLLGATLQSDEADFALLWDDLCPDEIKIYPTQLLQNTELYEIWRRGEYIPYTTEELVSLIADLKPAIPTYCRVNRVVRDIPATDVVAGNKRTSLRQDVHAEMIRRGAACKCIRCREVRNRRVDVEALRLDDRVYPAGGAEEHFLSFVTSDDKIAGFLRLSLPGTDAPGTGMADLQDAAIIREVHVFGQSLEIGADQRGAAQHAGLGTQLMQHAEEVARWGGFRRMAVISAVGTRQYYLERGFERGEIYLVKGL
jgi:elongator complex protein 3